MPGLSAAQIACNADVLTVFNVMQHYVDVALCIVRFIGTSDFIVSSEHHDQGVF